MTLPLSQRDLVHELGYSVDKGRALRRYRLVRSVKASADGTKISAVVASESRKNKTYSQSITLKDDPHRGYVRIKGTCSCPMVNNCKHVAAALLEYLEQPKPAISRLVSEPIDGDWDDVDDDFDDEDVTTGFARSKPTPPPQAAATASPLALTRGVSEWLDRLTSAAGPSAGAASSTHPAERLLLYVLDPKDPSRPGALPAQAPGRIRAVTVRVRKDGNLSDEKRYDPENSTRPKEQRARFLTEADMLILRDLIWLRRSQFTFSGDETELTPDAAGRRILESLLATGRLRYGAVDGPCLAQGPDVGGEPRWLMGEMGEQRLVFIPNDETTSPDTANNKPTAFDVVLPLRPPHYIDLANGCSGAIVTSLPAGLAIEVARAPVVAPAEAALVKEMLRQKFSPAAAAPAGDQSRDAASTPLLPMPEASGEVEIRNVTPRPCLELAMAKSRLKPSYSYYARDPKHRGEFPLPVAKLSFDYDGEIVGNDSHVQSLDRMQDGRLIVMPRDHRAELAAAERLAKSGLRLIRDMPFMTVPDQPTTHFIAPPGKPNVYDLIETFDDASRFIGFSAEVVPKLAENGWTITFADDYPFQIAEGAADWWADVSESSGIDWFSFELGVEFEGHRINLVPQLVRMLENLGPELMHLATESGKGDKFIAACGSLRLYHTLPDGRLLPLPGERLAPMLKALLELIGPRKLRLQDGKVRLHRAEAAALAEFAGSAGEGLAWAASAERLVELGCDLRRGRSVKPVKPPATFKASLRPYQAEGLAWLEFLRSSGFGGVLADDMGLGKTVQALAFLTREKAQGRLKRPALILSPKTVLPNWQAEAERFAPGLRVLALHGLERRELFGDIANHDVVLTTYPLLARDHDVLLKQEFHVAILDEAQAIKNPKATVSALAHRLNARHRLALTGTPLENNLGEVWSLFEFLAPGLLGDESTFRRVFRTPIEKHGDQDAQSFLSRRLRPFMLRRTKTEVATELPPKTEIIEHVQLEGRQRDLYETVRALMHKRVREEIASKGLAKSHIIFLDALLKLRQVCCDPRLLKMEAAKKVKESAKLERLMEMVPEMVAEGRRILLFSQFTSMLELIEVELGKFGIPFVKLTGDTADRAAPVRTFQAGKVPLFLLSLKAGGTGLNLTAADTVIHYDPWWNPAVENQATDRAHRIGQDKPVFVYKLIVQEGIEEAIELLKARKAALAEALFAGTSKSPLNLTESDISALFAPLTQKTLRRAA